MHHFSTTTLQKTLGLTVFPLLFHKQKKQTGAHTLLGACCGLRAERELKTKVTPVSLGSPILSGLLYIHPSLFCYISLKLNLPREVGWRQSFAALGESDAQKEKPKRIAAAL